MRCEHVPKAEQEQLQHAGLPFDLIDAVVTGHPGGYTVSVGEGDLHPGGGEQTSRLVEDGLRHELGFDVVSWRPRTSAELGPRFRRR